MKKYKLTAFSPTGEKLLDETFEAKDDVKAKLLAEQILQEKNLSNQTHRCTSSSGRLLLFHS
ncbi:YhzD family protein [Bacillus tuaregi]|uniref:YhzD family protein n=1 Tax=Bacillus tuaregi TaxID=1816695 RepID=UPI0008F97684|nr:YhzD family protein [Bacillus tuaregi]